ncbi:MAG TPA: type VI secretion system-associated FHA domain protein [Ramlibacter sp.]|nr:type VI secretion system-associated FHA domain protein [Ramlibacter sp.]
MALELHIAGPGLDVVRVLRPDGHEMVLGRDSDCGVCLPDPERNVSRRHLALWNDGGVLHFRVLSVVNGVEMPFGEAPPGAQGVLQPDCTIGLAEYRIVVTQREAPADEQAEDAWAAFDRGNSEFPHSQSPTLPASAAGMHGAQTPEEDPFGDWGFETTFGPNLRGQQPLRSDELAPAADLSPLLRGLGLDPAAIGAFSDGELETLGRLMRAAMLGLFELHGAAIGVKDELRAEDRTMVAVKDNNPLTTDWPADTKLQYLFGGRTASVGFIGPERALAGLLRDLAAHNGASAVAVRAAVEGTVREFSPEGLKARLLSGKTRVFEGTRAWSAYCAHYGEQQKNLPRWVQRLLNKYFTEAYLRESLRIKRETASPRD